MATLFGRMRSISRGAGSSAMTAAAYRSCSQLTRIITDKETGIKSDITYDYSDKKGLVFSQIIAPQITLNDATNNANKADIPAWIFDRQSLWQRIEDIETRVNSELAKEYVVALPKEFSVEQNIDLLKEFVETSFVSRDMVVDVNYHADNPENPHAHIMFPMRMLQLNEQGEIDFGNKVREWKSVALLNQIKQEQQLIINNHYAKNGFEYNLQWGSPDGLEATFHHGGIKNLWFRNQQILERNASRIIADPSLIIDKLDHNKSVFTSADIEAEIEKALQINIRHIKSEEYVQHKESLDIYAQTEKIKMLDTILLSPKLTVVNPCDLKGRTLFAKTKQVELEQRFVAHIEDLNSRDDHAIHITDKEVKPLGKTSDGKVIDFTQQQKEVIKKTLAGKNISIIEGWPGAGKSTVAKEIVRHYQERGYAVIVAAPTNKAAQELEDKLGVKAYTAAALRMKWQFERGYRTDIGLRADYYKEEAYQNNDKVISEKTVLIIDEISMIDTPTFDYFSAEILRSGNKLIGLGDNNQNQAIGMKGAASKAIEIAGSNLLTEINRHKNEDIYIRNLHIAASTALSGYQVPKALSIYEQLGAIKLHENEELKEQAIFSSYMEKLFDIAKNENIDVSEAASKIGMIAYTNAEIDRLNMMVRDSLKRSGVIANKGSIFLSGGLHGRGNMVELCEGDRIIFKSNQVEEDGYGGVMNNEIATIRKIISCTESGKGEFIADINRDGQIKTVAIKTGEEGRPISFRHAYAITNYAVQGSSIDHILMSIDKHSGYEVTLVGLTRHKQSCEIFVAKDTLENEVYRTKDLDVEKIREEYNAISYRWREKKNDEKNDDGKVYFEKEDVPLWKLGLGLLASKRSDLNFAIDHKYGNSSKADQDNLSAIYWGLGLLRSDLNKYNAVISNFELQANSKIGEQYQDEDGQLRQSYTQPHTQIYSQPHTQVELFVAQHFTVEAGEVMFDVRSVMKAPLHYEQINSDEISAKEHVDILKAGILKDGERVKLKWNDLSELDQNLLLHSYLDNEDKALLSDNISQIEKLELQIKQIATEHIGVFDALKDNTKLSHKNLQGNFAAVRNYLEARTNVRESYKAFGEVESVLTSAKIQKLLMAEVKSKYGIDLKILDTTIKSINSAEQSFVKMQANDDADQINKARGSYLSRIAKQNDNIVNHNNAALFVFDIMHQTQNSELSELWNKAQITKLELDEALDQRQATALVLIKNYHGGLHHDGLQENDNLNFEEEFIKEQQPISAQVSIAKLLAQLNLNYQTIAKHARMADERHYFEEIAKGSAVADEHYGKIMQLIEKAANEDLTLADAKCLLTSHYELAVSHGLISEYLSELKSQRILVNNQKNAELKLLQEHKLFRSTEFNSYIGQIYATNRLEVIENLDKLLDKGSDQKQLLFAISESPEMIGELKELGLMAKLFKSDDVKKLDEQVSILGDNLKRYVEGHKAMREIQVRMDGKYFQQQLDEINLEITKLQGQIAGSKEAELLTEISKIESAHINHNNHTNQANYNNQGNHNNQANHATENTLAEEKFANSITELFREDKAQDLLFNWRSYQAKISDNKLEDKELTAKSFKTEELQQQKIARLDFNEVANSLSSVHYESIFRSYANAINPDGKIIKKGTNIVCGSLNMNLKNGLWNRFSKQGESGNIFGFVAHATGVSKIESLDIVADYAGIKPTISAGVLATMSATVSYIEKNANIAKMQAEARSKAQHIEARLEMKEEWVAMSKIPKDADIFNREQHLGFMLKRNKLTDQYEYRDIENNLLGYAVRLEDRETGKKQVLPVAYCYNAEHDEYNWRLKGFSDNGHKPIYGAEKIRSEIKPILIVEGEKTANKAQSMLPEYTIISWMGGANAVSKVDWQVLSGREVVIWPDNDLPGVEAAKEIREHIDTLNGHRGLCSIINTKELNLPEKWDLADEVPRGIDVKAELLKSLDGQALGGQALDGQVLGKANIGSNDSNNISHGELEFRLQQAREILNSFDYLAEKGDIDIDKVHSVELYKKTLALIAVRENIDLKNSDIANQRGKGDVVEIIENMQAKYAEYVQSYDLQRGVENSKHATQDQQHAQRDAKQNAEDDLVREVSIFHQLKTDTKRLPQIEREHINNTVQTLVGKLPNLQNADLKIAGQKLDQQLDSNEWHKQLFSQHAAAARLAKAKLNTRTLDEFKQLLKTNSGGIDGASWNYAQAGSEQLKKIEHATSFLQKQAGKSQEQLVNLYKTHSNSQAIHKALIKECQKHNYGIMQEQLQKIDDGKVAILGGKEFTCKIAYLEHLHEHGKHDFLPRQQIKATLNKIKQQELEMHKQHHIGGPGM